MEKRQLPDGPSARQRIYLIGRLRKAAKWADLFSRLCAVKGDSRTSLEAEVCASSHSLFVSHYIFLLCIYKCLSPMLCFLYPNLPCDLTSSTMLNVNFQAYAAYMNGTLLFEQDRNWDTALKNFISARYMIFFVSCPLVYQCFEIGILLFSFMNASRLEFCFQSPCVYFIIKGGGVWARYLLLVLD